jgi:hypothetical protein
VPWSLDLKALDGSSTLITGAKFESCRLTWASDGVGAAEIDLSAAHAGTGNWLYGQRRILAKDAAGTPRFQGWLDRMERQGSPRDGPLGQTYKASVRGLSAILEQRCVHGDFPQISVVATTIATALLAHVDAQTDDKTNFTIGTITGVAPARSRWYCDGDIIKTAIDQLADMSNGFSWEIDAAGAFNAWVGGRGTDRTGTYTLTPAMCQDWSCVADMAGFASYITAIGQDEDGPCGPPVQIDFVPDRTVYGRRETILSTDTNNDADTLEQATEQLRAQWASMINLHTSWIEGSAKAPWTFGTVWLGDKVNAALGTEFGGTRAVRLVGITITLEPGMHEFVEMEWEAA